MPLRPPAGFISAFYDPLNNPNAPTIGAATAGDVSASVAFTAPTNVGGSAISAYGALSTPEGITASAASSPISVTGLTNGTSYTFAVWAINTYGPSAFSASSNSATPAVPDRGLFGGGSSDPTKNIIDYITISTTGNATDFGDLITATQQTGACASSTRGVWAAGVVTGLTFLNVIQYVTIASTGNSTDFGDLTARVIAVGGCSNSTRGLFAGGFTEALAYVNTIDYITIASTGNATNFGNLVAPKRAPGAAGSSTRALFAGGIDNTGSESSSIVYVTIASTGNATSFGNLTTARYLLCGVSSSTRAVFSAGNPQANTIDFVTIASTGNATNFGNLLTISSEGIMGTSNKIRGVFAGGADGPSQNVIQYITIASAGNATDFGDLTAARSTGAGCSDCHGGL